REGVVYFFAVTAYNRTGVESSFSNEVAYAAPGPTPPLVPTPTPTSTPIRSTLGNISTRLSVETGDNVLIGGFIVTGNQPKKIIVRAIGPSLSSFFPGTLVDPVLELRDFFGVIIGSNYNWRSARGTEIM